MMFLTGYRLRNPYMSMYSGSIICTRTSGQICWGNYLHRSRQKTYILTWTIPGEPSSGPDDPGTPDEPMEEEVQVEEQVTITRPFSYWQIDNLEVYKLARSTVSNYALPGGSVSLTPAGYTLLFLHPIIVRTLTIMWSLHHAKKWI